MLSQPLFISPVQVLFLTEPETSCRMTRARRYFLTQHNTVHSVWWRDYEILIGLRARYHYNWSPSADGSLELALAGNPQPPAAAPVPERACAAERSWCTPSPLLALQPPAHFQNKRFCKGRMLGLLKASTSLRCSQQQGQWGHPSPGGADVLCQKRAYWQSWWLKKHLFFFFNIWHTQHSLRQNWEQHVWSLGVSLSHPTLSFPLVHKCPAQQSRAPQLTETTAGRQTSHQEWKHLALAEAFSSEQSILQALLNSIIVAFIS